MLRLDGGHTYGLGHNRKKKISIQTGFLTEKNAQNQPHVILYYKNSQLDRVENTRRGNCHWLAWNPV